MNGTLEKLKPYSFEHKIMRNQLNIVLVFDFETLNDIENAAPYAGVFYLAFIWILK